MCLFIDRQFTRLKNYLETEQERVLDAIQNILQSRLPPIPISPDFKNASNLVKMDWVQIVGGEIPPLYFGLRTAETLKDHAPQFVLRTLKGGNVVLDVGVTRTSNVSSETMVATTDSVVTGGAEDNESNMASEASMATVEEDVVRTNFSYWVNLGVCLELYDHTMARFDDYLRFIGRVRWQDCTPIVQNFTVLDWRKEWARDWVNTCVALVCFLGCHNTGRTGEEYFVGTYIKWGGARVISPALSV